jgi:membrane-associated phospholipid phosphatase
MEQRILLFVHGVASPPLDILFRISHELGTGLFCTAVVILAAAILFRLGRRREALAFACLGISTYAIHAGVKIAIGRPRPLLWPGPVVPEGYAFPSGHALASATIYPLLAYTLTRNNPRWRPLAMAIAVLMALWIGIGRLYLGVHWPSDVLAGWMLGALQTAVALRLLERAERADAERTEASAEDHAA